jgi:23S rRNA (uracil1939-C5)-methyltransferase
VRGESLDLSRCPHAPACAACPLRGLPYREQLARKRARVVDALARHPRLASIVPEEVVGSRDLFGYRNVVKLAVRSRRDGSLRAGVYAPGTHRLVDAERCAVAHPALREVVTATLEQAADLGCTAYDERNGTGELRYLVARYSAWRRRVLLVLVTGLADASRLRELTRRLASRCRRLGGVVHNHNPERGNVILGRRWATLRPPAEIVDRVGFLELRASAGAFFQPNLWTARRIYETALDWAAPSADGRALDLFCGVGPLSLYLATRARQVIGIEEAPSAVCDARANQRRNGFHNLRFEAGRVDDLLPRLYERLRPVEIVTLNPPRKGASARTLATIAALAPRRIAYLSCNAETLARDLDRLAELGYPTVRVRPFDMLPQTDHVELVALAVSQNRGTGVVMPSVSRFSI